jgi:hypothetical protein
MQEKERLRKEYIEELKKRHDEDKTRAVCEGPEGRG